MYIIGGYIGIQSHTFTMCGRVQRESPVYLGLEAPLHRELYYRYSRRIYRRLQNRYNRRIYRRLYCLCNTRVYRHTESYILCSYTLDSISNRRVRRRLCYTCETRIYSHTESYILYSYMLDYRYNRRTHRRLYYVCDTRIYRPTESCDSIHTYSIIHMTGEYIGDSVIHVRRGTIAIQSPTSSSCLLYIGDHIRGGGLGSRPKKMYGERLGDGVEYHLMKPTPRR